MSYFKNFIFFLLNSSNAELILSILKFFSETKSNSTNDTLGVGTLMATPSSLPLRDGIISPIAFDAPVEVGTIDWLADRALLDLCESCPEFFDHL